MILNLPKITNYISVPATIIQLDSIEVLSITDYASLRQVVAYSPQIGNIIIWKDDDYDAIGDWTQEQANAKIISIIQGE